MGGAGSRKDVHHRLAGEPRALPRGPGSVHPAEPRPRRSGAERRPPPTTRPPSSRSRRRRGGSSSSGRTSTSSSPRPSRFLPSLSAGRRRAPTSAVDQLMRNVAFTPFTAIANMTGLPAMSLPLHWNGDGLPIGVQAIGPPAGEAVLLRLAAQIESARPWAERRPPLLVHERRPDHRRARHGRLVAAEPNVCEAQTTGVMRSFCPGAACSMRAALPREIATDMFA